MSVIELTKFYSDKGWNIFPCKPREKTPLVRWADEATTDLHKISDWWQQYPNANIGLATGERSGIFALDVDVGHGGKETLAQYIEKFGALPNTPVSNTGGGGNHYLFNWERSIEVRNSAGKLGPGLDTRGNGGYIVVPQSVHPSGRLYQWDGSHRPSETPTAPAPDWIFKLLEQKQTEIRENAEGVYAAGQRNNAMTSLAGAMRRKGMGEEAIFLALNAENLNKCIPPLTETEIRVIASSVTRYDPQAAPKTQHKDRIASEWAFAKCIYESPESYVDYLWLEPSAFGIDVIREYWIDVLSGMGVGQAAANAEILADLEHYEDWILPRIDDYANQIKHYGYIEKVKTFGYKLLKSAESGDAGRISQVVTEINQGAVEQEKKRGEHISMAWDEFEKEVNERAANPVDVWGIPFPHAPYLSLLTGGKQLGEMILAAGEPGVGKSWWWLQDALDTALKNTAVLYWTGEMRRKQVIRRMSALLGLNSRSSRTGFMSEDDWDAFRNAKATLYNIPLFVDDKPLQLHELRPLLKQKKDEHGIKQFVLDYGLKINAPGKDEIEKTSNISNEVKGICNDLNLAGVLIVSVNKEGMDTTRLNKAKVRGSGQQIHDADVIFTITKYNPSRDVSNLQIKPSEADRAITLQIDKGRELDHHMPGGFIDYQREDNSPRFKEMRDVKKDVPNWVQKGL